MADLDDTILSKWLEGTLNEGEIEKLGKEHDLSYLKSILDRQAQLDIKVSSSKDLWREFNNLQTDRLSNPSEAKIGRNDWSKKNVILLSIIVASIIAIALVFFNRTNSTAIIKTKKGATLEYAMKDGSKIHLSPMSSIEFDSSKWQSNRKIRLDGQAFFEVKPGSPFIVQTNAGVITVIGTSFDVWNIDRSHLRVDCTEGKVSVQNNFDDQKIIQAGEGIEINNNDLSDIITLDNSRQHWIEGQKTYRSSKIAWILVDLERFYNVKISIAPELKEKQFSGVIPTQDLDKAIVYLTKTMGWKYAISDKNITITSD